MEIMLQSVYKENRRNETMATTEVLNKRSMRIASCLLFFFLNVTNSSAFHLGCLSIEKIMAYALRCVNFVSETHIFDTGAYCRYIFGISSEMAHKMKRNNRKNTHTHSGIFFFSSSLRDPIPYSLVFYFTMMNKIENASNEQIRLAT